LFPPSSISWVGLVKAKPPIGEELCPAAVWAQDFRDVSQEATPHE